MSAYLSRRFDGLAPYVPGEQPKGRKFIRLNTNESPFPVSEQALREAERTVRPQQLYSDPESVSLRQALAEQFQVKPEQVLAGNGSDELLSLCTMAYCDETRPALFPDITYGFYRILAGVHRVPCAEIPLQEDFTLALSDYRDRPGTVFLANPNAPTGIPLKRDEIARFLEERPGQIVVVDEAYVDFYGESCVPLVSRFDNLVVVQTFSKSRSMAGARLGFAVAQEALIQDLNTLRNAISPYNLSNYTQALGVAVLHDGQTVRNHCAEIVRVREWTRDRLAALGFSILPSAANFLLCRTPKMDGKALYLALKEHGILVRHFDSPRIRDYNRISVGSASQMEALLEALNDILKKA